MVRQIVRYEKEQINLKLLLFRDTSTRKCSRKGHPEVASVSLRAAQRISHTCEFDFAHVVSFANHQLLVALIHSGLILWKHTVAKVMPPRMGAEQASGFLRFCTISPLLAALTVQVVIPKEILPSSKRHQTTFVIGLLHQGNLVEANGDADKSTRPVRYEVRIPRGRF